MGVAGALGCVWGSALAYWAGKAGGRPFIEKYGRYLLISHRDLDMADRWFGKYGAAAVFFSRLLPIVRTYISFPAGIARVPFWRFIAYTFAGSLPWCLALAWAGKLLGEQWDTRLKQYFHGADAIIIAVVLVLIALYIWRHVHSEREYRKEHAGSGK
jgi:membrane protein DedA with SNARE-associated domain